MSQYGFAGTRVGRWPKELAFITKNWCASAPEMASAMMVLLYAMFTGRVSRPIIHLIF